jgi:LacI family transcriptional regulator
MSIRRLASNLGLSVTTVSRALAGYSDVAAKTRERVQREAVRSGYRPNPVARRLRTGRSGTVGIVVPSEQGTFDQFFLGMLGAIGPLLSRSGLDLVLMGAPPGEAEMHAYRHLVEHHRVDGILLARTRCHDARIRYLLEHRVPFVAHGRSKTRGTFAYLDIDGEAAFAAATERLIGLGHRHIGLINAPEEYMFAQHRASGWLRALGAAALPQGPALQADATEENGFRLMNTLLQADRTPTAVLCATDRMAVGALHAIASTGLRAGRDVSVIGYDDLPMAAYTDPPLTTFEQPIPRMAQRMVEMLLALLDGADASQFREVWVPRLIARLSDGPVPKTIRHAREQRAIGGSHVQEARDSGRRDNLKSHSGKSPRR